ncbi:hypothetical protein BDW74DRAFT_173218 [Aspergillus multicolor]|uniref:uncharacterized protein n=1 Tax=Aspergillus multicolor TaxID=41759 RepID=UPI003CCD8FFE
MKCTLAVALQLAVLASYTLAAPVQAPAQLEGPIARASPDGNALAKRLLLLAYRAEGKEAGDMKSEANIDDTTPLTRVILPAAFRDGAEAEVSEINPATASAKL